MHATVQAPTFAQSIRDLADHPVIDEMARDLLSATPEQMATLTPDGVQPNARFMAMANARFAERTGHSAQFLGSVGRAVLARRRQLRAEAISAVLAAMPNAVTEAAAAELEARQALRDMWAHGFTRCPLTRYAETAGDLADRLNA